MNCSVIANIVNSELPTVRKKERDYMGMFEFSKNDVPIILQVLITGKQLLQSVGEKSCWILCFPSPTLFFSSIDSINNLESCGICG